MRLTANFELEEFVASETALKKGIINSPSAAQIERLRWLCAFVLQPIRDKWGYLKVTSGYRNAALNAAVGGAASSAHMGLNADIAADVQPDKKVPIADMFDWIRLESGLRFDQIILERGRQERHEFDDCIHVAIDAPKMRRIALAGATHGRTGYTKVEVR